MKTQTDHTQSEVERCLHNMKHLFIASFVGWALIIAMMASCSAAEIIDDFSVKQRAFDKGLDKIATITSRSIESCGLIPELTRQLVSYTPAGAHNYTDSFIYHRKLFITNKIVDGASVGSGTSIIYEFNNFDIYGAAQGFYLKLDDPNSNGRVVISTNGPSGFSYSNFHDITDGYIIIPLTEFNGARLFNNLTFIRIDFIDVDGYSGPIEFGFL